MSVDMWEVGIMLYLWNKYKIETLVTTISMRNMVNIGSLTMN